MEKKKLQGKGRKRDRLLDSLRYLDKDVPSVWETFIKLLLNGSLKSIGLRRIKQNGLRVEESEAHIGRRYMIS
ncbi:hypothetical protein YC2023_119647 [Brassica napus]